MDLERIRDAAAGHTDEDAARSDEGKAKREDARDPAADWAVDARCDGLGAAGRTDHLDRLRRDSGRWWDENGFDYGSVCGVGAGAGKISGGGDADFSSTEGFCSSGQRGDSRWRSVARPLLRRRLAGGGRYEFCNDGWAQNGRSAGDGGAAGVR